MNKENRIAIFGLLHTKDAIGLLIYAIIVAFMATSGMDKYITPLCISLSFLLLFYNKALSLGVLIVTGPLMQLYASGFLQIFAYVPLLLYLLIAGISQGRNEGIIALVIAVLYVSISYLLGYNPDIITYILQINCMLMCYATYNMFKKEDIPIFVWAYICASVMIIIYMSSGGLDNLVINGRLNLGEGSKSIALVCATPMIIAIFSLMSRMPIFENRKSLIYRLLTIFIIPLLLTVILATGARGILIGVAVGVLFFSFTQKEDYKKYILLCLFVIMAYQLFNYVVDLDLFRMDRFMAFEEYSSGNGRTEIWGHYFKKMSDMGSSTILFGTGPGNIARISKIGFYAHSTFLDYYFSFGLLGFLAICFFEIKSLQFLYYKENMIPFTIVVTLIICSMTHGTAANTSFFMLQSLMMAYFKKGKR